MDYQPYKFSTLEKFSHEAVNILNRTYDWLAAPDTVPKLLKSVSETLLSYDIYNVSDMEIGLLVKPAGTVSKPQFYRLQQQQISIGRVTENDIALKSPLVSKKHAEVFLRGTDYYLKDCNSNNGTYLNQVRLSPGGEVLLKNDDTIKIEPFEITVGLSVEVSKRPLDISFTSARVVEEAKSKGQIQIFFEIQPSKQIAVFLLDQAAARWMVQKIITGQTESVLSPWTEIETGLLEYLSCKIISVLNAAMKETRLLFQTIETEPARFQLWSEKQAKLIELDFAASTEIGMIYGYLYIPLPALGEPVRRTNIEALFQRAEWLRNLKYTFSINLGASMLLPDQISLLEEGDILLVDRSEIILEKQKPKGKMELRSDRLHRGAIRGSLLCGENASSTITVESLYQEGLKGMTDANKKSEAPQEKAEEGVLSGIEIPVNVEFARLNFTLEEISSLKEGQIIEIEKTQPELVDLSIEGRIIANGKLVDVDGKLGVRLLKVIKPR